MQASSNLKSIPQLFRRTWWATVVLVVAISLYFVLRDTKGSDAELYQHVLLTIAAVMVIHLLDRMLLYRDSRESLAEVGEGITNHIKGTVQGSVATISSSIEQQAERQTRSIENETKLISDSITSETRSISAKIQQETANAAGSLRDEMKSINDIILHETDKLAEQSKIILGETSKLTQLSASIAAMANSGIARLYSSRAEACSEIKQDLTNPSNRSIRLIGISLNDILRGDQPELHSAWLTIQQWIKDRDRTHVDNHLDIKVLIIDPNCFGAQLRSTGEMRQNPVIPGRLATDVKAVAPSLVELQEIATRNFSKTRISFECRLYQLPPIMFLCHVDSFCYVQQYHFWSGRLNGTPIPMLKYRKEVNGSSEYPMHSEMSMHFDWIWQNASIPVAEYEKNTVIGTDQGIHLLGAANIYTNPADGAARMLHLLESAQQKVAIQGISLASFFEGSLLEKISALVDAGTVNIQLLLLDPECEQAKYRSYREYLFTNPTLTFEKYKSSPDLHAISKLVKDTTGTITEIRHLWPFIPFTGVNGTARAHPVNLSVRLYDSAPGCFMLQVDDHMLIEQYHYGKMVPGHGRAPVILGKDMPLVEYTKDAPFPTPVYGNVTPLPKSPFELLVDHFDFAFKQAKPL